MKEPVLYKSEVVHAKLPGKEVVVPAGKHVDSYQEISEQSGFTELTYTVAEAGSLEAVIFQNVSETFETKVLVKVVLQRNARLKLTVIQQGGLKSQLDIVAEARGEGAEIDIRGLQNAKHNQKLMFSAHAHHFVPHTRSDLQVWCVAGDESHSIFNGMVTIEKGAHHTEAYQRNKNLLLSERATVDSFPKLFIGNHDVKCAHGSSTSQIEPEQFYYLQARGIDAEAAEQMLVKGFMHQSLEGLTHKDTKQKLIAILGLTEEEFT
ncbi:MAG: SufD family Fe-S cluster assembly protein [Bdellovibrionales bacterium]|nr:SufD family Fe-S cluster assembly protein [Oligoflexia bacterium]